MENQCLVPSKYGCQCAIEAGHDGDHDSRCGWGHHRFPQSAADPGQAVVKHEHGWHFGYITCSCGWERDARTFEGPGLRTMGMDTALGMRLFEEHKSSMVNSGIERQGVNALYPAFALGNDLLRFDGSEWDRAILAYQGRIAAMKDERLRGGVQR